MNDNHDLAIQQTAEEMKKRWAASAKDFDERKYKIWDEVGILYGLQFSVRNCEDLLLHRS